MNRSYREILDAAARPHVPDDIILFPRIAAKLERKTFMQTLRARPALAILIVMIALSLLSGVVYAIGRSLGYIPGVGIVEQGTPIRVLAEPVSVERDGITLTITEAVLSADKTVVVYTIENVPWDAISHQEDVPGCYAEGQILLPNGSTIVPQTGSGGMDENGRWETRMVYSPVPPEINEAEFLLDCIRETLPGLAPENWELSLRFVPAPPDTTIIPVVEIPTGSSPRQNGAPADSGLILEKVIETEDGYILIGKFHDASLPDNMQALGFSVWPTVMDANGVELPYLTANDVDIISTTMGEFPWTLEIKGKAQAWPLTIQLPAIETLHLDAAGQFTFDAGQNPQPGQEWILEQDVNLGDFFVRVEKVSLTESGYLFDLTTSPDIRGVDLTIANTISMSSSGGGDGEGNVTVSLNYEQPPSGVLTVQLSYPTITLHGNWSLQWVPENAPEAASLYGISLKLDQFIPLDDGYYLIGHTEWTDERVANVGVTLKAHDASGRELALEPYSGEDITIPENGWAFKVYGKVFDGDVRLAASEVYLEYSEPALVTIDLRPFGFTFDDSKFDVPYKTGLIPVDVPGLNVQLASATYIKLGDMRGFELAFETDPRLKSLGVTISDGLDISGLDGISSSGASFRDPKTGFILSQTTTNARLFFPLMFRVYAASLQGDWSVSWTPPAPEAGATPFYAPEACLTLDIAQQALANPPILPAGLDGKLLLMRGAVSPDPTLFISNLDGSGEIPLAFGHGTISPDERQAIYSDENNRLILMEISSKQKTILGDGYLAPIWSPDGTRIAFQRQTPKGFNIFVMDADGKNPRALTDTTEILSLDGWSGDGESLLIQTGTRIELLSVSHGSRTLLIETKHNSYGSPSAALSPDGQWLAYLDEVPGKIIPGLFLSRLDGTDKRLLAQLEHWPVFSPVFSPDGKWLAVSMLNTDLPNAPVTPVLVNLGTCQVVPLPGLDGEIKGWVNP